MKGNFRFFNLDSRNELQDIGGFFPNWRASTEENVVIFSPHDDDAMLGAGYAILASLAGNARVHVVIFNRGDAGYSNVSDKATIVETRKHETIAAYLSLGIPAEHILRLELPDFSGNAYVGRCKPTRAGEEAALGTFDRLLVFLRKTRATRLLFANGFREHIDHTAVAESGLFYGPQVGDPVVVDWAEPWAISSFMEYSVWGSFDPIEAIRRAVGNSGTGAVPANLAIVASEAEERRVQQALQTFASQQTIIKGILENRKERQVADGGFIELYMAVDPRPKLDYRPYKKIVDDISGKKTKK